MNDLLSLFLLRSTTASNADAADTADNSNNNNNNNIIAPPQQQQQQAHQQLVVDTSSSWEYLSLRDLYQLKCVSKEIYKSLEWVEYNRCRDGKGESVIIIVCYQ